MNDVDPTRCPLCSRPNRCALATPGADTGPDCWCFTTPLDPRTLQRLPAELRNRACLCPACAQLLPPESSDLAAPS